jgi:cell division septation protein DedD
MDAYLNRLVTYKAQQPLRISYGNAQRPASDTSSTKPPKVAAKAQKAPAVSKTATTPAVAQTPKTAAAHPAKGSGNLGPLPYTIQVSSYRNSQKSIEVATQLKNKGDPAFTSPVLIPEKGRWHRVYIGFYQTFAEAKKAANRLKKRNFSYTEVAKKPLAVQVGMTDSYKDARAFKARLREKGYMAYSLLDRKGRKKTRILVGAYGSQKEARYLIEQLKKDGFTATALPR